MNFRDFQDYFKKDVVKRYNTKNSKNLYYTNEDLKKAYDMACNFYKKQYNPILLKQGNLKLEKNVLIWDLPSIVTCKYACSGCYALKPERIYKNTRVMRAFHFAVILMAIDEQNKKEYLQEYLQNEINKHVTCFKLPVVRIHSSGDFFNKKYLQFWLELALKNKKCNFYTYSKQLNNDDINIFNKVVKNFNIVKSIIHGHVNYGNDEQIKNIIELCNNNNEPCHVCDYGQKNSKMTCMGNCTACLYCSNVIFHKH